jgi:hypothetical protein
MTDKPVAESLDVGTREAVNDFFDALSKWRDEVASSTERYSETVLDKMVVAATAMGWSMRTTITACICDLQRRTLAIFSRVGSDGL